MRKNERLNCTRTTIAYTQFSSVACTAVSSAHTYVRNGMVSYGMEYGMVRPLPYSVAFKFYNHPPNHLIYELNNSITEYV